MTSRRVHRVLEMARFKRRSIGPLYLRSVCCQSTLHLFRCFNHHHAYSSPNRNQMDFSIFHWNFAVLQIARKYLLDVLRRKFKGLSFKEPSLQNLKYCTQAYKLTYRVSNRTNSRGVDRLCLSNGVSFLGDWSCQNLFCCILGIQWW